MKRKLSFIVLGMVSLAGGAIAQDRPGPPPQAYEDCRGRRAGDTVQHTTREGVVAATCMESPNGLAARPVRNPDANGARELAEPRPAANGGTGGAVRGQVPPGPQGQGNDSRADAGRKYSLQQAVSDRAQLNTIAFDGLAFLTGDFGYDSFLPPGKVSDYFGFQYMRDIDVREGGHNTNFLTRIAHNMLTILDAGQKAKLLALANQQQADIRRFAEMRLPLIKAFRLNLEGGAPQGSSGLSRQAVVNYSAELYAVDGKLSYERAKVMAEVLRSLSATQKAALGRLKFGDSGTWPDVPEPLDRRSMGHEVNVAVMTYASEMFSWYAGSVDADTYFCPERHGMYFGGFGMKTAPVMGKRDYSISTTLTGNSGESFLAALSESQRRHITALPNLQRQALGEIVGVRQAIATELRRFLIGDTADRNKVIALSKRYGELDGELSYLYAVAFARVGQSLSAQQKQALTAMRASNPGDPKGPFLYSTPIAMPKIDNVAMFFGAQR